jgi:F420-non-reducing hydrogenase large subunit
MSMSIKKAAEGLIRKGTIVREPLLDKIEMAFRAYDPCLSCATHAWDGALPLSIRVRDACGNTVDVIESGAKGANHHVR